MFYYIVLSLGAYPKRTFFFLVTTIGAWVLSLRIPFIGLIYYQLFVILYFQRLFSTLGSLHIARITALLAFLGWFSKRAKDRPILVKQSKLMIAFLLVMCLSTLNAGLNPLENEYVQQFFKLILAHILIINIIRSKEELWLFAAILPIAAADLSIVSRLKDVTSAYYWFDKNHYGAVLVSTIAIAAIFALRDQEFKMRLFWGGIFTVISFGVLGSFSRGAFIGFAGACFLILLTNLRIRNLIILSLLATVIISRTNERYFDRIKTIFHFEQVDTAQQRMGAAGAGFRMVSAAPILGIGVNQFENRFSDFATVEEQIRVGGHIGRIRIKPHNMFIQVASETGLVGFLLFLLILYQTFRDAWKVRQVRPKGDFVRNMAEAGAISLVGLSLAGVTLTIGYGIMIYTLVSVVAVSLRLVEYGDQPIENPILAGMLLNDNSRLALVAGALVCLTYLSYV